MIQEKDFLYRVPVKNALVTAPGQQVRNPEILVDTEGGEFMCGNILDANSTNKLVSQSVKEAVDNKITESGFVTKDLLEAETKRATGVENNLKTAIDGKADATALSNYVLTAALNQQVDTLNAAISAKQDAGNYLPYESVSQLDSVGNIYYRYTIKKGDVILFKGKEIGDLYADTLIGREGVTVENNSHALHVASNNVSAVTKEDNRRLFSFELNEEGVRLYGGDNNHVLTSNQSTIDITQYAKKAELPTAATKEGLGIVKVGDGLNVNAGVVSVAPDYLIDMMSYGVEFDVTVADPACTRIGNPLFHKSLPIQSEYKGCIVKNGKLQYYLNPNDWSKKADGKPSVLDGTDGDVMIHTPKFYGKSGSNGNKKWVRISTVKIDASWVEIPEMFVSAYRVTTFVDSGVDNVASVVNTTEDYRGGGNRVDFDQYLSTDKFRTDLGKPRTGVPLANMRVMANNSGQELLCYEFYKWIFYWSYVIEYANFNSQKEFNSELTSDGYHQGGLGPGLTTLDWNSWATYNGNSAITPCGYTNEFGNFSGVKAIQIQSPEKTLYANRWRGFENPFGDILTNLEGIIIKRDTSEANSNVYTTTDSSKYGDDYSLFDIAGVEIAQDGWIGTFDLGSKAEIIPSSVAGSESTYKCDYHHSNTDSIEKRTLLVGGSAAFGGYGGLGYFDSNLMFDDAVPAAGFRSLVRV